MVKLIIKFRSRLGTDCISEVIRISCVCLFSYVMGKDKGLSEVLNIWEWKEGVLIGIPMRIRDEVLRKELENNNTKQKGCFINCRI